MNKRLSIPLLLVCSLASCDVHKQEDATRLSDDISHINDSLSYYGKMWNDELVISVNQTKNYTNLAPIRRALQSYIDRKFTVVQGMHDVGGSEELRKTELEILSFEKSIADRFIVFEQFDSTTSQTQLNIAYENLLKSTEGEAAKMNDLKRLRDDFAEKNEIPKPVE